MQVYPWTRCHPRQHFLMHDGYGLYMVEIVPCFITTEMSLLCVYYLMYTKSWTLFLESWPEMECVCMHDDGRLLYTTESGNHHSSEILVCWCMNLYSPCDLWLACTLIVSWCSRNHSTYSMHPARWAHHEFVYLHGESTSSRHMFCSHIKIEEA